MSSLNILNFSRSRNNSAVSSAQDEEELEEGNKSIIMDIIGQLRNGTDFHKVTLPTFILEPRSMCERLSDFFCFQDYLLKALSIANPTERMLQLTRWVMSGHHTRPKGVKKPFNPILGEFFRCEWKEVDQSTGFYICEQISHHPPGSAFFYANPTKRVWIVGFLKPYPRFLGNSAGTMMAGGSTIYLGEGIDEYDISNPNVYARSILFGKMFMELGDSCSIKSKKHNVESSIEFKQKGFFGDSDKDLISGKISENGELIYKLLGKWSDVTLAEAAATMKQSILFDGPRIKPHMKIVKQEEEQEEFESRRLWKHVSAAVIAGDHKTATHEKTKIEDNQRKLVKHRSDQGITWEPRFFCKDENESWIPMIFKKIKQDPTSITDDTIREFIFAAPEKDIHKRFWVKGISTMHVEKSTIDLDKI